MCSPFNCFFYDLSQITTSQSFSEWSISNQQWTSDNIQPLICDRENNFLLQGSERSLFSANFFHLSGILLWLKADATCLANGSSKRRNTRRFAFLYKNIGTKQSKRQNLDVHTITLSTFKQITPNMSHRIINQVLNSPCARINNLSKQNIFLEWQKTE